MDVLSLKRMDSAGGAVRQMKKPNVNAAQKCAEDVSRKVGRFLKRQLRANKRINQQTAHDIKLELDDRSQRMLSGRCERRFRKLPFLVKKAPWVILCPNGGGWSIPLMAL